MRTTFSLINMDPKRASSETALFEMKSNPI